jgi:HlyD family secretion protein
LVSIFAFAGCAGKPVTSEPQPSPSPGTIAQPGVAVRTEPLRVGTLAGTIDANGQVVADAGGEARLAFPTDGQIASIAVNVGDRVSSGQILGSLDARTASAEIVQAQADVAAAQANLAKAQARARPQEFAQNSATVAAVQAKAVAAKAELDRQTALANVGISSQRDLQQAQSNYASALADERIAREQGSILQAGARPQDVAVARAAVQQAQAALSAARTKASLLNIVAPFDGVITQRSKNPGETADPATPVLAMVNPRRTVVEVQLSQDEGMLVRPGAPAGVSVNGTLHRFPGTVIAVSPELGQQTGTMTVRIRSIGDLTPGAAVKATITVRNVPNAFVVPASAVVKDPETGATLVYVAKGAGNYVRVPVQIRLQSANRVAIASAGLAAGQSIVTQGAYELLPSAGGGSGG